MTPKHSTLNLFTDGGARGNPGPSAIGIVITDSYGVELLTWAQSIKDGTNNVAEYKALTKGLILCKKLTRGTVICHSDSQLMVNQLNGVYRIRNLTLQRLAERVRYRAEIFQKVRFVHVSRTHPKIRWADHLLNQVLDEGSAAA